MSSDNKLATAHPAIGPGDWCLLIRVARQAVGHSRYWVDPMDVAQEAYVALTERSQRGWSPENLTNRSAYCAVVVRNVLRRMVYRAQRSGQLTTDGVLPQLEAELERDEALTPEDLAALREAAGMRFRELCSRLRPSDRSCLELLVQSGSTSREIARALGTTVNHVHQMRHRILSAATALREVLCES